MKFLRAILIFIFTILMACERNHEPVISNISYEPDHTSAGAVIDLRVNASDEDRDPLRYNWEASHGEFLTRIDEKEVAWKAPADGEGQSVIISVVVSDGEYEVSREVKFELTAPLLGNVIGHVYFRNTNIPLPDVDIRIDEKETHTDLEGYFELSGVIARKDSLYASKEDFNTSSVSIKVIQDQTLDIKVDLLSIIHSSKTYGVVRDQNGELVEYAQVIMLNPDGSESSLKAYSNQDGLYRISYIPHGIRTIIVRKEHNESERFDESRIEVEFTEIEKELNLEIRKEAMVGEFTDPRDQQVYSFRKIGDYTWMTENLAYLPQVNHPSNQSETEPHYYVYAFFDNKLVEARSHTSYLQYGVLYNWVAAKQSCPPGWYFPSNWEYSELGRLLGDQAGYHMKSQSGWYELGNGDNSSGFSAIPGGRLNEQGSFEGISKSAHFHTATIDQNGNVYFFSLSYDTESLDMNLGSKKNGLSVRCIKKQN